MSEPEQARAYPAHDAAGAAGAASGGLSPRIRTLIFDDVRLRARKLAGAFDRAEDDPQRGPDGQP